MVYALWTARMILTKVSISLLLLLVGCSSPDLPTSKASTQGKIVQIVPHSRIAPNFWRFRSTSSHMDMVFRQSPPSASPCYMDSLGGAYEGVQVVQSTLRQCDTNLIIPAVLELIRNFGTEHIKETVYTEQFQAEGEGWRYYDSIVPVKLSTMALYYSNRIYWRDYKMPSPMLIRRIPNLSNLQLDLMLPYYQRFADSLERFQNVNAAYAAGLSPFNAMPDSLKTLWLGTEDEANNGVFVLLGAVSK